MASVEIIPARTADPGVALELVRRDGAAILTGVDATPDGSIEVAHTVLGDEALDVRYQFGIEIPVMLALKEIFTTGTFEIPDGRFGDDTEAVRGWTEFFTEFLAQRKPADHTETLAAHVDGYAFGAAAPDYIFQVFAQQSDEGGESVLLDGIALVDGLDDDLRDFARSTPIDQTEPGLTPYRSPILQGTRSGRLRVIRHEDQAPDPDHRAAGPTGAHAALIERWQAAVQAHTEGAAGFKVCHGEALCLDNYRLLHARRPYDDVGREVFVSWAWTEDAEARLSGERLMFAAT